MKTKIFIVFLALAAAYLLLLAKPELYFNKSMDYGIFTLRARGHLPEAPERVLDLAKEKIASSELYHDGELFELILPETSFQFKFFTPFQKGDFFRVNPYNGDIFIGAADFPSDLARPAPGEHRVRSLSGAIVAAAAREMTRRKLRPLTYLTTDDWKVRGYEELLSGGTGEYQAADACSGSDRPGLEEYRYGLILDTVLKEQNLFYNDLLDKNFNKDSAEKSFRARYCGR